MPLRAGLVLGFAALAGGCSAPVDDEPAASPTVVPVARAASGAPVPVDEGSDLVFWSAPQGGHALMIGIRLAHRKTDLAHVEMSLRNQATGTPVVEGDRTMPLVEVADGVVETDAASFGHFVHLLACPNLTPAVILEEAHVLSVVAKVPGLETALKTDVVVHPICAAGAEGAFCRCECEAGYEPGKCASGTGG